MKTTLFISLFVIGLLAGATNNSKTNEHIIDIEIKNPEDVLIVVEDVFGNEHYTKIKNVEVNHWVVTGDDKFNKLKKGYYKITGTSNNNLYQKVFVME